MTGRQLNVAPAVAQQLPAAHLAQLQAEVNDPDNRCPHCHQLIEGRTAEAIILKDGDFHLARLAHPECARSGIYEAPGVRATFAAQLVDGLDITTRLGRRRGPKPRAVVFIELLVHVSAAAPGGDLTAAEDPLTVYARILGLEPVTGGLEQITPSHITTSSLHVDADGEGLTLTHPAGQDTISTDPSPSPPGVKPPAKTTAPPCSSPPAGSVWSENPPPSPARSQPNPPGPPPSPSPAYPAAAGGGPREDAGSESPTGLRDLEKPRNPRWSARHPLSEYPKTAGSPSHPGELALYRDLSSSPPGRSRGPSGSAGAVGIDKPAELLEVVLIAIVADVLGEDGCEQLGYLHPAACR